MYLKHSRSASLLLLPALSQAECTRAGSRPSCQGSPVCSYLTLATEERSCYYTSYSSVPGRAGDGHRGCRQAHTSPCCLWVCRQPQAHNIFKACKHFLLTLEYAACVKCSQGQILAHSRAHCSGRERRGERQEKLINTAESAGETVLQELPTDCPRTSAGVPRAVVFTEVFTEKKKDM